MHIVGNQYGKHCLIEDGKYKPEIYTSHSNYELIRGYDNVKDISFRFEIIMHANVIIFERIKEEIRKGNPPLSAIELGYDRAFITILDANITTLLTAIILFLLGTGPIKGFAITLSTGILCSMFTAIYVTRTIFLTFTNNKTIKKLSI